MNGYIKIAIAAVIWGSIGTVARTIDLPVPVMTFYRVFFAAIAVLIYMTTQRKLETLAVGRHIYRIIAMGVLLAINWMAFFYSIRLTSVANAVLITYTAPIYVALLAPLFLKERLEKVTVVSLVISLAGAVLIAFPSILGFGGQDVPGIIWAFVSSLTYAILVILSKPLTAKISVLAIIFYEELTCTAVLSPALFFFDTPIDGSTMFLLLVLGVFQTALAAALYLSGLRVVKAQQVGIFTYLDPASAVVFAALFLGEIPTASTLIGGLLIIASGLLLVIVTRERMETEVVSE